MLPQHLDQLAEKWHAEGRVTETYANSVARVAMMAVVMALYRLHETRTDFLLWLLDEAELQRLGLPRVEAVVGDDWSAFMIVRGQYVGHARRKPPGRRSGQIVPGETLGRATRRCGMLAADFLLRLREQLVPGVERVRDELYRLYPEARRFTTETHGADFKRGAGIE